MIKPAFVFAAAFLLVCGSPSPDQSQRTRDDGTEAVINHLKPARIEGEPSNLILEEEFRIDTENAEVARNGLTDAFDFIVDSEGNIYFDNYKNPDNMIHEFDQRGRYVRSFGRKGQGPGELQAILLIGSPSNNQIIASDAMNRKYLYFDSQGTLLKEVPFDQMSNMFEMPLKNGNVVVWSTDINIGAEYPVQKVLSLLDSSRKKIKEIDRQKEKIQPEKIRGVPQKTIWHVSTNRIYVGRQSGDYEILVYDFDGRLVRNIRKEYRPVHVSDEYKNEYLKRIKNIEEKKKVFFPEGFPPFQYIFADEKDYLFVMTYEEGKNPNGFIYDIFDPSGRFIARTALANFSRQSAYKWYPLTAMAKRNRIYCLGEKETGYKELVVYKMKWE